MREEDIGGGMAAGPMRGSTHGFLVLAGQSRCQELNVAQ